MGQQNQQILSGQTVFQDHRGAESPQQGGHRFALQVDKGVAGAGLGQDQRLLRQNVAAASQLQGQGRAFAAEQTQGHRDHKRGFAVLVRCGRAALGERERVAAFCYVEFPCRLQARRARLAVPMLEGSQVLRQRRVRVGIGDRLRKVVASHGLAIVALKVELHALGKSIASLKVGGCGHQGLHHANDFRAFFVDGDGVEVVDFNIAVGAHRVGHGAGVLGKLHRAQHAHVFDAFDGAGAGLARHVLAELLITENCETFFERELEPVAAGDPVARPVVEVLVAHHGFDVAEIHVGGGGRVRQHVFGVEDVQTLVFHRTHVEVAGGDDHEAFQVQRQAKAGFVPGHAGHEGVHRVFGLVQIAGTYKHLQQVLFAAATDDALFACDQLSSDQGKQVAGFFVRVDPFGKVATVFQSALLHQVAVGKQHGVLGLVSTQRDGVAGHHVRTVQKISDAAETFSLALGEKRVVADVQAHQLGVLLRVAGGENFEIKSIRAFRQIFQNQLPSIHLERCAPAVDHHARQIQVFAIQAQRLCGHIGVAAQAHLVQHAGFDRVQIKGQIDRIDPESRGGISLPVNR